MHPSRRIGLAVCCLLCSLYVKAQDNGLLRTDLISPSPTAASISKYGDMPVTYYTGLPNVSVPIFTIEGHDLSVPVSLSYNYNGFKPSQEAGWTGLGWTLNAGGVITRTIGDKIDGDNAVTEYKSSILDSLLNPDFARDASRNGMYDTQPDIYDFNFGSYSGKFILYQNKAYIMPFEKLRITRSPYGFNIVTEDGTHYEFLETETTVPKEVSQPVSYTLPASYVSSWYLSKITNASGNESITFQYESDGEVHQYGMKTQSYEQWLSGNGTGSGINTLSSASAAYPTKVSTKRLASITSDKYEVLFREDSVAREDLDVTQGQSSRALRYVRVYSSEGALIKTVAFTYGYFGSGGHSGKYLKLASVADRGQGSSAVLKYTFAYNSESITPFGHGYDSYVDHYGFLKGAASMPGSVYIPNTIYAYGTNRDPVAQYASYGALTRITYPTGGTTLLEYEGNKYYNGVNYLSHQLSVQQLAARPTGTSDYRTYRSDTFHINHAQDVILRYRRIPKNDFGNDVHDPEADVKIFRIDGYPEVDAIRELAHTGTIYNNSPAYLQIDEVELDTGHYFIEFFIDPEEDSLWASVNYSYRTSTPIEGLAGPGIRVKRITAYPDDGPPIDRHYRYVNDAGFSTANLASDRAGYTSRFFSKKYFNSSGIQLGSPVDFAITTSTLAERDQIGAPFCYRMVTEEVRAPGKVNRSRYYFKQFAGFAGAELIKKIDYVKSGSTYAPVLKTENGYATEQDTVFNSPSVYLRTQYFYPTTLGTDGEYDYIVSQHHVLWKYPTYTRTVQYAGSDSLVTRTDNTYNTTTRDLREVKTTNADGSVFFKRYKYPIDYASSVMSFSAAENFRAPVIEDQTWKKVGSDTVMISGKINSYNGAKRLTDIYLLETGSGVGTLSDDGKDGNGKYTDLVSDSHYALRASFTYDNDGRVIAQQLTNDMPSSYLWDYPVIATSGSDTPAMNYPVAEIKNASTSAVYYTSFENSSGTVQPALTGKRSRSNADTLNGSFTGSYKLTYWKKCSTNPWTLVQATLTNPNNHIITASGCYIDEVRLIPANALITTYAYEPGVGLTAVNDPNNEISFYEYDYFGRLKLIRDNKGNILKTFKYHFKHEADSNNQSDNQ